MGDVDITVNYENVGNLLKGAEVQKLLGELAGQIQNRAGDEYAADVKVGTKRARATIKPGTPHAYYSNLKHNTLLKSIGG